MNVRGNVLRRDRELRPEDRERREPFQPSADWSAQRCRICGRMRADWRTCPRSWCPRERGRGT